MNLDSLTAVAVIKISIKFIGIFPSIRAFGYSLNLDLRMRVIRI